MRHPGNATFHLVPGDEVVALYKSGMTCSEIGARYEVDDHLVAFRLRLSGIEVKKGTRKGPRGAPRTNIYDYYRNPTKGQKREATRIWKLYQKHHSVIKVAARAKRSQPTVSRYIALYQRLAMEALFGFLGTAHKNAPTTMGGVAGAKGDRT
jgi:hypothetical protein